MAKIKIDLNQLTSGFVIPLLVLVVAVVGYFVLLPKYKDLRGSRQALAVKENDVSLKESQLSSVQDLIADFKQKKDELAVLDEALPDAPRVPELLATVDSLAQSSGILIANVQLTIPPALSKAEAGQDVSQFSRLQGLLGATENLAVLQMDLILKGQYTTLKTFLTNLEQTMRLMDVQSFTFTPVEKETGVQEYALKIQTYYYRPPK